MAGETERAGGGLIDFSDASVQMFLNVKGPYEIRPHAHPHFELIYILRGTRCLVIGGKTYRARRGDLMIFRPGDDPANTSKPFGGAPHQADFVIGKYAGPSTFMGLRSCHTPDNGAAEVITAAGVPIHNPADQSEGPVGCNGSAFVFDPIK